MLTMTHDLLISTGCMLTTCLLSQTTRNCLKNQFSKGLLGVMTMEFVAMFELCAVCYELAIIAEFHGIGTYFILLFGICLWRSFYWQDVNACPYSYVEGWLIGSFQMKSVLIITLVQLFGGSFAYNYYTKFIWSLEFSDAHKGRFHTLQCKSDVQVIPFYAALVEGFGVFTLLLTWKAFSRIMNSSISNVVTSFVGSCLVVAALGISGGYFNPALASVLQHGCSGSTLLEQFLVYWVPDTTGAILAHYFWNYIQFHPALKTRSAAGVWDTQKLKRG